MAGPAVLPGTRWAIFLFPAFSCTAATKGNDKAEEGEGEEEEEEEVRVTGGDDDDALEAWMERRVDVVDGAG